MTVSHLTRTRDQLWSDLLVALGGSEAFLTRSLSERKILLEILETYGSSVSLLTIDDVDALLASVVNAAGGTASHLRQSKHEMLAALVTALGGTAPSASSSSIGELLAACVNAADTGGGGGGDYVASAVHFDGLTYLVNNAVSCTDSFDVSLVAWFKSSNKSANDIFVSDPLDEANNLFSVNAQDPISGDCKVYFELGNIPFVDTMEPRTTVLNLLDDAWHCVVFSGNTNHVADSRVFKFYVDDVDVTGVEQGAGNAFAAAFNAVTMYFGKASGVGVFIGDMADFRLFVGTSFLELGDIPLATRRLFRTAGGKPVDPSVATAALGTAGTLLFSGDAATFADNQGGGGSFAFRQKFTSDVLAGAGPISIACVGLVAGQPVYAVDVSGGDWSAEFEATVSVNDQIQQTGSTDLSGARAIVTTNPTDPTPLTNATTSPSDTGGGGLPAPPSGYAYIVNADGSYLVNADGAYILAKA